MHLYYMILNQKVLQYFGNLFALFLKFQQKQSSIQSDPMKELAEKWLHHFSASSFIPCWHQYFEAKKSFTEASTFWLLKRV